MFPRMHFGVEQTVTTVLAHELFGHAFDDLIGWDAKIDFGTMNYNSENRNWSRIDPRAEAIGVWVENQYRKRANLPRRLWYRTPGDHRVPGPVFDPNNFIATPFGL